MTQDATAWGLPAEVLDDVARVVGAEVTVLSRLAGGVNAGAVRVRLTGGGDAVLKAVPWAHADHVEQMLRAQRVVEHVRTRGYPPHHPAAALLHEPLDAVWRRLWARILDLVEGKGAAVLTSGQLLLQLEWTTRLRRPDVVAEVVARGHRALDELAALC